MKTYLQWLILIITGCITPMLYASGIDTTEMHSLIHLQKAYPDFIAGFTTRSVIWQDGTQMPIHEGKRDKSPEEKLLAPALIDQVKDVHYPVGMPSDLTLFNPVDDPGRIRYEPFFEKMYGDSEEAVRQNLALVYWMPAQFGHRYPLLITRVNGVADKLQAISQDLEELIIFHPEYLPYLENPGTFNWRVIAATHRLSPHSFGMTIDINPDKSNYWQWDLAKSGIPISEDAPLKYQNSIPWEIVLIFEKHGFVWGGKWHHYDTMHFEYRPELL